MTDWHEENLHCPYCESQKVIDVSDLGSDGTEPDTICQDCGEQFVNVWGSEDARD